jgi:glycosyltransferase involved in cell wall biosynthesis
MAAVGGYRVIKFCKFLPEFGWHPTVLTVGKGFNYAYDRRLVEQIDRSVRVYRSGNLEPLTWWDQRSPGVDESPAAVMNSKTGDISTVQRTPISARIKAYVKKTLSIPDRNNFWIPFGVWTGLKAIRNEKIDLIYSTSPPASAHLIGCLLSRLSGKPLLMDFRDLWTQNEGYQTRQLSPLQAGVDRWLEKRAINRSRAVVSATETFSRMLRENNPSKDPDTVFTITNGVDADDFDRLELTTGKNEKFNILHLGSMYGNRNPIFCFQILIEWAKTRPEIVGRVQVDFIGNVKAYEKLASVSPLSEMVKFLGHIPNSLVLPRLWQADLLLLILGFDSGAAGVLPAKLFEYACTGRPILAFVPRGEAQAVLETYDNGSVITSPDINQTIDTLNNRYDNWLASGESRESKISIPPQFDRRMQAKRLADAFNSI